MSDNNTNTENTNNNTNNDNNNTKEKNKSNKKNIIIDFFKRHFSFMLYSIICIIFLLILICKYSKYTNESKTLIENSIKQFELNSQTQLSNYYEFLKETVTNESFESKEFIKNTLEEAFKPNIDLLRETLKDSKDFSINTVTFWLAFLSLIMIIFTILGIYANNKIMESNQRQSELIINETELKSKESIENIRNELSKENKEYIENLKVDFNNIKNNVLNEMNIIKTEAINAKDNVKKSEVEINNIKTDLLKEKDTLIENAKKELNEQKDKITEFIETIKDNAINKVDSIKEEINNNKSEAEKMLKEMKEERESQKEEGKTILTEMKKRQKVNDLLNKAWSESNKNNKEEAIKFYTEALEIDSKNTIALNNRGALYSNKYKETKDEKYFNKSLEDYNKILNTHNNDIDTLNNRGNLYSDKYEIIKEDKYFNKALEDYNKVLSMNKNYYRIYINTSFLYLTNYKINKEENKESLIQAEKYLNEGFKISPNNLELINNYGIFLYLKNNLNKSEKYLKKSINKSRVKENLGETYYYLYLVYKKYSELDNNNSGYSKEECENKSKEYLQQSEDLGYKHFMEE
ncbi:hypothetical protein [Brachyspira pilosicoli]|uniref:hypothetical protein n=1 Tax=Brachyspira pilosicoli TaxID=52584 RepID=UPI002543A440|nr:hypothetical protein [Brachyspira pilosicoli]WIH88240.1 hypothetical protein NEI05_00860 [Brachyspira pilosicoli]